MRFSLGRLLIVVLVCSAVFAIAGAVLNQTAFMQVLFRAADKEVLLTSSSIDTRGTFFELRQGNRALISKKEISLRPIKLSRFQKYDFAPDSKVVAYFAEENDPEKLNVLLLVDLESDAYSAYWGGCRAKKCQKLDWAVWDQREAEFQDFRRGKQR